MSIELFRGTEAFVAVAEALSYRKAAAKLGVGAAALSKAIVLLEKETKTQLLHRTPRQVSLTSEGKAFFDCCREAVRLVNAGREALNASKEHPQGKLVVSCSWVLAQSVFASAQAWLNRYPQVELELRGSDRVATLESDDIDLGIRLVSQVAGARLGAGESTEHLVCVELLKTNWVTLASPAYLARKGEPQTWTDLTHHDCIRFKNPRGQLQRWWHEAKAPLETSTARLVVNNGDWLLGAAFQGLGLCQTLDFLARPLMSAGQLVPILNSQACPGPSVVAVFLPRRRQVKKIRSFVDHLLEMFPGD